MRILRYVKETKNFGMKYEVEIKGTLIRCLDSNRTGCQNDRKSTLSYVCSLKSEVISWSSKKQKIVALSSCEVEYIFIINAVFVIIWLRRILKYLLCE